MLFYTNVKSLADYSISAPDEAHVFYLGKNGHSSKPFNVICRSVYSDCDEYRSNISVVGFITEDEAIEYVKKTTANILSKYAPKDRKHFLYPFPEFDYGD